MDLDADTAEDDFDANSYQVKVASIKEEILEEDDSGLEKALAKARKLKEMRAASRKVGVFDPAELIASQVKPEIKQETEEEMAGSEFISTFDDDLPVAGKENNNITFARYARL